MVKKVKAKVKIYLPGGGANPGPPVATSLGQFGVSIVSFCKMFNERTKGKEEFIIPVIITIYEDKSFNLEFKSPPASMLIKKAAGIAKASGEPNKVKVGEIRKKDLEEIAKLKMEDLNAYSMESAVKIIEGTAKNMGVEIVDS